MIDIKKLSTEQQDFESRLTSLMKYEEERDQNVDSIVANIIEEVKTRGDLAVLDYTRDFDHVNAKSLGELEIEKALLYSSLDKISSEHRQSLECAAKRIRVFHEKQKAGSWDFTDEEGITLGQKVTALEKVGVYVPGGKAAYPSTVMMNSIPARVADVNEIIMVVPTPNGEYNDLVMAAAAICDVDRVFTIGGAQAIAALGFGTQTIPQVDKIVGPGNIYVATAKRQIYGTVGIDMIAGPSEILIICDGSTDPDWVAMDLFSQAEHDEQAQAILLTPSEELISKVLESMNREIGAMPRREVIRTSLENRGALIKVKNLEEACEIANRISPEHLELSVAEPEKWVGKIKNAGAIFIGAYASESLGDYCAGPNHVLPTSRTARFSSPLGVYDFQKRSSLIQVSREGAIKLGPVAAKLAMGEGLPAHARSAELRIK